MRSYRPLLLAGYRGGRGRKDRIAALRATMRKISDVAAGVAAAAAAEAEFCTFIFGISELNGNEATAIIGKR